MNTEPEILTPNPPGKARKPEASTPAPEPAALAPLVPTEPTSGTRGNAVFVYQGKAYFFQECDDQTCRDHSKYMRRNARRLEALGKDAKRATAQVEAAIAKLDELADDADDAQRAELEAALTRWEAKEDEIDGQVTETISAQFAQFRKILHSALRGWTRDEAFSPAAIDGLGRAELREVGQGVINDSYFGSGADFLDGSTPT